MDIRTKLDLGCGMTKQSEDWISVDISHKCNPDYVWDVTKTPYPAEWAEENKFDRVRADNLLEHFDWEDRLKILKEVHRILKPRGIFWIRVPNAEFSMVDAIRDPTHKFPPFVPSSFDYFDINGNAGRWKNFGQLYGIPRFRKVRQVDCFSGFPADDKKHNNIFIICEIQKV